MDERYVLEDPIDFILLILQTMAGKDMMRVLKIYTLKIHQLLLEQ